MTKLYRGLFGCIALFSLAVSPVYAAVFVSDDFSATNLDTQIWSVLDPAGGANFSIVNQELAVTIPAGVDRDVWSSGNNSSRIMQSTDNVDFEIEVKFSSLPTQQFQMQGLIIEQDAGNFLRFDFYSDGGNLLIFAASFTNGNPTAIYNNLVVPGIGALYMRVTRTGDQWAQTFSVDGQTWSNAASFNHVLTVNSVGPFVANAGALPAFSGVIDYFFNTASPIVPEDGGSTGPDTTPPFIYNESVTAASGTEITVSWNTDEPADGLVEYGLTTAYELGSVSDLALTTGHSFSLTGLQPDTTYQVRMVSADGAGNTSTSQNHAIFTSPLPLLDIWYGSNQSFGSPGQGQAWINILGKVTDPDGIVSLTYSLNGQAALPLTVGPDQIRLQALGDFNVEISYGALIVGQNTIVITARDGVGFQSTETVYVDYSGPTSMPVNYSVDWSTVANIQDIGQVVDGLWGLEAGSVRPLEMGYDRLIDIGDVQWQNYEVTVPITVHSLDPLCGQIYCAGGGPIVGLLVRWPGHYYLGAQPNAGWFPMGALGNYYWDIASGRSWLEMYRGSDGSIEFQDEGVSMQFNVPYLFKVRAETTAGVHRYSLKMWPQSDAEPPGWNHTFDEALTAIDSGSLLLVAHHVDVSFGNVVVTALGDQTPPTISNIRVSPAKKSATITWQTDEPADSFVAYGSSSAYESGSTGSATLVTTHSVTLTNLTAGTLYHYQISSGDGSGNVTSTLDLTFATQQSGGFCTSCHQ